MLAFLDRLSAGYAPEIRYPDNALNRAIKHTSEHLRPNQVKILDIGCGDGYPASRLLALCPWINMTLIDISEGMLSAARIRLEREHERIQLLQGDFNSLAFPAHSFDAVWSCCSIQFVRDIHQLIRGLRSVLRRGGLLIFVFNAREDLHLQMIHNYFPLFHEIELKRHWTVDDLMAATRDAGFQIVLKEGIPYRLKFENRSSLISFVKSKPFSGFALMGEDSFEKGFRQFAERVTKELPEQSIYSDGRLSLIIARSE